MWTKYGEPYPQPSVVMQRLRLLVGAYISLNDNRVNKIFFNQVNRIGNQLEILENALPKHPRVKIGTRGQPADPPVVWEAWKPQKLKVKWFEYMDNVYEEANKKGSEFMEVNMRELKDKYKDSKMISHADIDKEKNADKKEDLKTEKNLRENMKVYMTRLEAEWAKHENWAKPK